LPLKNYDFEDDEFLDDEKYLFLLLYAPGIRGKINETITYTNARETQTHWDTHRERNTQWETHTHWEGYTLRER